MPVSVSSTAIEEAGWKAAKDMVRMEPARFP
jgi:hypothetical protein